MKIDLGNPLTMSAIVVAILIIVYFLSPKVKQSEKAEEESTLEKQVAVSSALESCEDNEQEIVAAIMGALTAHLDIPASKLKIKTIKRVDGNNSTWRKEALKS